MLDAVVAAWYAQDNRVDPARTTPRPGREVFPSLTAIAFGKYTVAEPVAAANWAGRSREGRGRGLHGRPNR
jgi:hypothetical protein